MCDGGYDVKMSIKNSKLESNNSHWSYSGLTSLMYFIRFWLNYIKLT